MSKRRAVPKSELAMALDMTADAVDTSIDRLIKMGLVCPAGSSPTGEPLYTLTGTGVTYAQYGKSTS